MSNANSEEFEQLRQYVQGFTIGAAVFCGLVWLITLIPGIEFQASHMLLTLFSVATEVGGTVMGILYLIHRSRER